jgi:hypothetical protein
LRIPAKKEIEGMLWWNKGCPQGGIRDVDRRVGQRIHAAPGGEGAWLSGRGLELKDDYNSTGVYTALIVDIIHLPAGNEIAEDLAFAVALRLGATFFVDVGFLTDTAGTVGEGGEDPGTKPLVNETGESGTRDGVERDESAVVESTKVSGRVSSFISRPSFGFPTARS